MPSTNRGHPGGGVRRLEPPRNLQTNQFGSKPNARTSRLMTKTSWRCKPTRSSARRTTRRPPRHPEYQEGHGQTVLPRPRSLFPKDPRHRQRRPPGRRPDCTGQAMGSRNRGLRRLSPHRAGHRGAVRRLQVGACLINVSDENLKPPASSSAATST